MIAGGSGRSWDLLVDYPLTDFRDYQTLPFPLSYNGPLNTGSPGGFLADSASRCCSTTCRSRSWWASRARRSRWPGARSRRA